MAGEATVAQRKTVEECFPLLTELLQLSGSQKSLNTK